MSPSSRLPRDDWCGRDIDENIIIKKWINLANHQQPGKGLDQGDCRGLHPGVLRRWIIDGELLWEVPRRSFTGKIFSNRTPLNFKPKVDRVRQDIC